MDVAEDARIAAQRLRRIRHARGTSLRVIAGLAGMLKSHSASMRLAGMLALCRSLVAAADNRPGDVEAPLDPAAELATHTGEGNAYWMSFGPTNVGCWRLHVALECGDYGHAVTIAESLHPQGAPAPG